jgi:thiamine-phosphate pyrophosphorylase
LPENFKKVQVNRIIDANINRLKEGLRVCEEITRFIFDNRSLTAEFKKIRHNVDNIVRRLPVSPRALLESRKSSGDIGKNIYINELKRDNLKDIFFANIQRAKESVRVLEEFTKLIHQNLAVDFKRIRYQVYELEKKVIKKIPALSNTR